MWSAIRWLVLRIAAIRWLFKLGWLGALVPIALLLKTIGLPLLAVLAVIAAPVLILLFLFGLPVFLVIGAGAAFMGLLGIVLFIGVAAIKFALFVVLPIWLMWKLAGAIWRWGFGKKGGDASDSTSGPVSSEPPPAAPEGGTV